MNNYRLPQHLTPYMDLAVEAHDLLRGSTGQEIHGVRHEQARFSHGTVTTITILNEEGEQSMGRPKGTYVTIESGELRHNNWDAHKNIARVFADALKNMIAGFNITPADPILVVGLGNWNATPDALGPKVVNTMLVTRHMFQLAPKELTGGLRPVCALAPGVLGITGIETAEIIQGVIEKVQPKLVIAVDALAAGNVDRIASTIQLASTGISPGSGIHNQRKGINQQTMGVPVIAVGIPTVVNALVLAFQLFGSLMENNPALEPSITQDNMEKSIQQVLGSFGTSLTVTPKEIDELITRTTKVVASGLNQALHVAINPQDYALYLQ